jgi:hypothetical protein
VANDPLPSEPPRDPQPKPASFLRVMVAVFWSFFGVRKKAAGEHDMVTIKPVHVVIAGVLGAAILVAVMITLVRFITHDG